MKRTIKPTKSKIGILLLAGIIFSGLYQMTIAESAPDWRQKMYGVEVQRDTYLKAARQQISELKTKVEVLNVKAKKSSRAARLRLEPVVQGFQRDLHDLDKKCMDLKNSGVNTWDEMKNDLDASIKKLRFEIESTSA
ncbi:hypothetical protein [Glaciimonas sp. PAMC28666]|uniref:hypothetical protein n=1 Tax=Glaciimonas sp. PAMC28666 TaxID=2807626 RepID=UPI00196536BA|nr:hypothetical protein [Glaciimonas sp. PAMC28666]QRX82748.1 hypothetical protein JQN73_22365 [Glaciimonas sp. PAMC28666]